MHHVKSEECCYCVRVRVCSRECKKEQGKGVPPSGRPLELRVSTAPSWLASASRARCKPGARLRLWGLRDQGERS